MKKSMYGCVCASWGSFASATSSSFLVVEGVLNDTNLFEAHTFEFMVVCLSLAYATNMSIKAIRCRLSGTLLVSYRPKTGV